MREHHVSPYASVDALFEVQLQVDSECDLGEEHEHEGRGEGGVDVGCELAAAVSVAEEVSDDGEKGAEDLDGDVETGADDLWWGKGDQLQGLWKTEE